MKKGGYKIIDLADVNLITGAEAITIRGIYEDIEHNFRKSLKLSGITIDGVEKNDADITVTVEAGDFKINVYGKEITINADDEVAITNGSAGGGVTLDLGGIEFDGENSFTVPFEKMKAIAEGKEPVTITNFSTGGSLAAYTSYGKDVAIIVVDDTGVPSVKGIYYTWDITGSIAEETDFTITVE